MSGFVTKETGLEKRATVTYSCTYIAHKHGTYDYLLGRLVACHPTSKPGIFSEKFTSDSQNPKNDAIVI